MYLTNWSIKIKWTSIIKESLVLLKLQLTFPEKWTLTIIRATSWRSTENHFCLKKSIRMTLWTGLIWWRLITCMLFSTARITKRSRTRSHRFSRQKSGIQNLLLLKSFQTRPSKILMSCKRHQKWRWDIHPRISSCHRILLHLKHSQILSSRLLDKFLVKTTHRFSTSRMRSSLSQWLESDARLRPQILTTQILKRVGCLLSCG